VRVATAFSPWKYAWRRLIDLHAHILPGLDDGPPDLETSVSMARIAADDGIATIVAAPRVRSAEPSPEAMLESVGELNLELARRDVALAVLPGGLVDLAAAARLQDSVLRAFSLGRRGCVLIESPYVGETPFLEELLADVRQRGFRVALAHPERSSMFQQDDERLARVVRDGTLCVADAGSITGRYGEAARRCAIRLFGASLVHAVGTGARDDQQRAPRLRPALDALARELPVSAAQATFLTRDAPEAILAGQPPPRPPAARAGAAARLVRLLRR
jgi:protein-tyrosine phosphatase